MQKTHRAKQNTKLINQKAHNAFLKAFFIIRFFIFFLKIFGYILDKSGF